MGKTIGIDLGTTNSCVAVLENGSAHVIPTRQGQRTLPSVVAFTDGGQAGRRRRPRKRQAVTNPQRTVYGVKRLIGRKANDRRGAGAGSTRAATRSSPRRNGDAWVRTRDGDAAARRRSRRIVLAEDEARRRGLPRRAGHRGRRHRAGVLRRRPAPGDQGRRHDRRASTCAHILNEPTAAALALRRAARAATSALAVFDLGGGTFDISIMRDRDAASSRCSRRSGDTFLGGDDFDRASSSLLVASSSARHGVDLRSDPVALQRLKEAAERAKMELSSATTTDVNLPFIAAGRRGPLHLHARARARRARARCASDAARAPRGAVPRRRSRDAQLRAERHRSGAAGRRHDAHAGGAGARSRQIFGKTSAQGRQPRRDRRDRRRAQSAIMGGELQEVVLLDVTPHSLGVKVAGDRMSVVIAATPASRRARRSCSRPPRTTRTSSRSRSTRASTSSVGAPPARPVRARRPAARSRGSGQRRGHASRSTPTACSTSPRAS